MTTFVQVCACSAISFFAPAAMASDDSSSCKPIAMSQLAAQLPAGEVNIMQLPRTGAVIAQWNDHNATPHYAVSIDGQTFQRMGPTSYNLRLRYGTFDPIVQGEPAMDRTLRANAVEAANRGAAPRDPNQIYIVQFVTQPLEEFRQDISDLGGTIHKFLASHSYIVKMGPATRDAVAALPYVRWVGEYHPAYRLEEYLLDGLTNPAVTLQDMRYRIQVFERGPEQKNIIAKRIADLGGQVQQNYPDGFILEATLSPEQLLEIAHANEVMFIDRWSAPESDLDLARQISGATYVQTIAGYTGAGVRGEVMDGNIYANHVEFANNPPIIRTTLGGNQNHGTSTYGIVFGSGNNVAQARGILFGAEQGIFSDYNNFGNRYAHTQELLQSPHYGVFQSNSWGSSLTTQYNTFSAEMDDILFNMNITILQSQSNAGSQSSRPQAWAKNIVSVGGVRHYGSLNKSVHQWNGGASIGPAADGRIKPDLTHFYDGVFTTRPNNTYTDSFGGTSAATPITAGYFGLFYEMWSDGLFGNEVDPDGTVFDNRPASTTAKAVMINTASQYPFLGTSHDLTRTHQGWGMVDVQNLYDLRNDIFIIDANEPLTNLQSASYTLLVEEDTDAIRATMVYLDPSGTTSSNLHRINDLTLRVTSPSGTVYYGNVGLNSSIWSAAGGQPNTVDTVENVFVENPEPGHWEVTVLADEIVEDAYPALAGMQAAYSLVVTGVQEPALCPADLTGNNVVDVEDLLMLLAEWGPCNCPADLTGDNTVDVNDLLTLLSAWGNCP